MTNDKAIVWFQDVGKGDIARAGGKGPNLGEMTQAQIPVPPGFIVAAQAYFDFVEASGLRPKLEQMLAGLNHQDSDALQKLSERIKETTIATPMPQELAGQIKEAYSKLGGA